jgi:hypothetical protein
MKRLARRPHGLRDALKTDRLDNEPVHTEFIWHVRKAIAKSD